MKSLRIFISSPGDVSQERERASQVIQSLQRRYSRKFILVPVFWENLPLEPDMSFQQGIDLFLKNPGVDVAVFILWSRLGSPLGASIRKADGSTYRSGTEREYDLMLQARAQSKAAEGVARPRMVIYTRRDDSSFDARLRGKSTAEKKDMLSQKELVESFMKEAFKDAETGENIGAYHPFDRPVTFSQRLRIHLQAILDELAGDIDEVIWDVNKQGPPFLGLDAFQPHHADVFFGREEEILEARNSLKEKAANGCAFLLLSGASGSGKSSLARAGILPEILAHEPDEHAEVWKSLIAIPAELGPDPILGLITRLADPNLLPEISEQVPSLEKLAIDLAKDAAGFFDYAFPKAIQAAATRLGGSVRILIVLDQLEELFTKDALTGEARAAFLALIETLARSGRFWIIATVRSDFYQEIQGEPALVRLKEGRGLLDVLPPQSDAIVRLIEEPARLAGLTFEEKDGQKLSSRILRDAAHSPELLPLLEFVLLELFNQDKDIHQLTHATYETLGGVEGALRRKAETTFTALSPEAQSTLPRILQSLVTLGDEFGTGGESDKPVRLRAPLSTFPEESPAHELITAFTAARLFTTAQGDTNSEPTVTVAHESLLRVWPRAVQWKESNIDFLRTRARIATRMKEGSPLLKGDPLLDTAKSFLTTAPEGFPTAHREWIQASIELAEAKERLAAKRRHLAFATLTVLTLLAVVGAVFGWRATLDANHQRNEAQGQSAKANAEATRALLQLERSHLEEGRAWLERAKLAESEGKNLDALMLAGRAVGFVGYGQNESDSPEIEDAYPTLLGRSFKDPQAELQRLAEFEEVKHLIESIAPTTLPIWSTPVREHHHALVWSVAFSPKGSHLASGSDDGTVKLWDVATGKLVTILEGHAEPVWSVAFSPDGRHLASGCSDMSIKLWDLETGKECDSLEGHSPVLSVAFSPDGSRLASGLLDNTVKIWDVSMGKLLTTFEGHEKMVLSVAFSPDGRRLASGSADNTVRLWDLASGVEFVTIKAHSDLVNCVVFSPDGSHLASASNDKTVKLFEVTTGKELATLQGHLSIVSSVAFSPDGSCLASGSHDKTVKLWDMATGKELIAFQGNSRLIRSVAFSQDGSYLASGSGDNTVKVWEVATGINRAVLDGHSHAVICVAFSPDGSRLASGSEDKTVKLWDVASGKELATLEAHSDKIHCVAFSPDGSCLASGSWDNTVKLWDVATGKLLTTLVGHAEPVWSLAFSPDGVHMVSGSGDMTLKLWDVASGKERNSFEGHSQAVLSVAFSPDGSRLASGSGDGTAKVWDTFGGTEIATFEGHSDAVRSVAFMPDGSCLASGSWDSTVKLWELETGNLLATFEGHSSEVVSVAFSPDGSSLASGSNDNTVKLWNVADSMEITSLQGHSDCVLSVAFSPDGSRLASGSEDKTVKLWDVVVGNQHAILCGHASDVTIATFSPDSSWLASGSNDKTVKLWDVSTGKEIATLEGHKESVKCLVFNSDGSLLASGSDDNTVKLWNLATGKELATYEGHSSAVICLAFSPDGGRIASGSHDKSVKLWDVATGKEFASLEGHSEQVSRLVFSPDSRQIASGSPDKTVKLWDVATGNKIATLEGHTEFITGVAFSPDGSRLASDSWDQTVKLWDTASGQEIIGTLDFSFERGQDRSGRFVARRNQSLISLCWESPTLDLLAPVRTGHIKLKGREIVWNTNPSLRSSLEFQTIHYRPDLIAQMAAEAHDSSQMLKLRLQLCAKGGQWRALLPIWNDVEQHGLADQPDLRHEFIIQLSVASSHLARLETTQVQPEIANALANALQNADSMDFDDARLSLALAQAIPMILSQESISPEVITAFTDRLTRVAPMAWLEAVCKQISKDHAKEATSESIKNAQATFVQAAASIHPDSIPLLRK